MFVAGQEISVNWLLPNTNVAADREQYDISVVNPLGDYEYIESAILEADYVAPTPSTLGAISYRITPTLKGVWVVTLILGDPDSYQIHSQYFLRVSTPDIHVKQTMKLV